MGLSPEKAEYKFSFQSTLPYIINRRRIRIGYSNSNTSTMADTTTRYVAADGLNIFYREAGPKDVPIVLLLHGFPSSSHQFRHLIPLLSQKYQVLAPDLPGFGFTEVPETRNYTYTFENLTKSLEAFLDVLDIKKFAVYIFDYGAPVALRLALHRPHSIQAIITQNGNAYEEGLGEFWDPLRSLWKDNSTEDREKVRAGFLSLEATKWQYVDGAKARVAPEAYYLDYALLSRPGNQEIQLDLFYDYQNNVKLYPKFQEYFRKSQVPLLAAWGKNDTIFIPAGVQPFKKDLPNARIHLLDAGHFALETNAIEVADLLLTFLSENGI